MYRKDICLNWHGRKRILWFAAIVLVLSSSCDLSPKIHLDGGNPPRFSFTGREYLEFFVVTEIAPENQNIPFSHQDTDKNKILWWVFPTDTSAGMVQNLSPITYGVVPPKFVQKTPAEGSPPALVEGKVYEAGGPAISLPKGFLWFTIRDGRPVQIAIPGL